jgi:hypothetical protein
MNEKHKFVNSIIANMKANIRVIYSNNLFNLNIIIIPD